MSMQTKIRLLSTMQCRNAEGCSGCFCGDCKGQGAARFLTGGLNVNEEYEKEAREDSLCDVDLDVDFNLPSKKDVSEPEERNKSWIEQEEVEEQERNKEDLEKMIEVEEGMKKEIAEMEREVLFDKLRRKKELTMPSQKEKTQASSYQLQ